MKIVEWVLSLPIRIKVLVFGLFMSIIPLFVLSSYFHYQAKVDLEKSIIEKQHLVLKGLSREIDLNLFEIFQSIQYFSNIRQLEKDSSPYYELLNQHDSIEEIVITDYKGFVEERVSRYKLNGIEKKEQYFSMKIQNDFQGKTKIFGSVELNQYGQPVLKIAIPLIVNGQEKGLGVLIQLQKMIGEISSFKREDSSNLYLMDQSGRIIAHQDYSQLWKKRKKNNKNVIAAEIKLEQLEWVLVMEQQKKIAFQPIRTMLENGLMVMLIFIAFVSFISIYAGLFFTKPIVLLEKAMNSMKLTLAPDNVKILRKDELGRLVLSFNKMKRDLQENSAKLEQERERLKVVVESIGAGLALITKEYQIIWMNPILENWTKDNQFNKTCYSLFAGGLRPCEGCPLSTSQFDETEQMIKLTTVEGEERIYRHRVFPLAHSIKSDGEYLIVIEDITEKKQMEEKMIQTDKLSALGLMASSFAHEVNNPLATVHAYAEDLIERMEFGDRELNETEMMMYLEKIKKNTERCKKITDNLLNFSRKSNWNFAQIYVKEIVVESLTLVEYLLKNKKIDVSINIDDHLPPIVGDGLQLMQVFVNLLHNSIDAIEEGGKISIDASQTEEKLFLKFLDTGSGISNENLAKIFDPFFTTKPVGKGTGLGLSVCFGIIEQLGGKIDISSQLGKGTSVEILIPLHFEKREESQW